MFQIFNKTRLLSIFLIVFCSVFQLPKVFAFQEISPADLVNPFIGASTNTKLAGASHGLGKTFPGATTPFGMVQVSPNTITGGDNGPGYSDEHRTIEGFAMTQMSGIGWYGDLGNFLVMPSTGPMHTVAGKESAPEQGYRSRYDKSSESASAGYYQVHLSDYNIHAELTASQHAGMMQFTFPENNQSRIQIDLARRVGGTSTEQYVEVVDEHTIKGWMKCTPEGGGWGNGVGKADYTVYFYTQFNKALKDFGVWEANIPEAWERRREEVTSAVYQERVGNSKIHFNIKEKQGKHLGFFTSFSTKKDEKVQLKVGISFASLSGAEENLKAEIKGWDFDEVKANAKELWNEALGKMKVSGGSLDEQKVFYTALYHTMIDPRDYTDVNGQYTGGDGAIHQTDNYTKRTVFSGWDVFRSQFPLQTIINPEVVNDMINSLVYLADESGKGYLERWEFLNAYSGCMVGNPAISVITDAYVKGIRGFDAERALELSVSTSKKFGNGDRGYDIGGRSSISNTLEYAYTEWCTGILAKELGDDILAEKYLKMGQNYRNIYDEEKGWFRPRDSDGAFFPWPEEGRKSHSYGCVESNAYQQGWFVPHDVPGMVELMGGRDKVLADLENFFDNTPEDLLWNDYYNHANEPVHHVPFLFNYLDAPWLTQKWTRFICQNGYENKVTGLKGNEDVGQMSAWYVLAASGIYQVSPGNKRFEITSPVFDQIEFNLDPKYAKGNKFTVIAHNNSSENIYIQKIKLNGEDYDQYHLSYDDVMRGGVLELYMGSESLK